MKLLYTVGTTKLHDETIGGDKAHDYKIFEFYDINVMGNKMYVSFCRNEKGMFVIAGTFRRGAPRRSCDHRWHRGDLYLDVYFRKNFRTREEGNAFYKKVKQTRAI